MGYPSAAGEKLLRQALEVQRKTVANDAPEIAATLEQLCKALERQKKTNEAAVFRKDLTALRAKLLNETPGK